MSGHSALVYSTDDELVSTSVGFLQQGLDAGEVVTLRAGPRTTRLVSSALGDDRLVLDSVDPDARMSTIGPAQQRVLARELQEGAPGFRIVGEVETSFGRSGWDEWARLESGFNWAFGQYPWRGMCLYDSGSLPGGVVAEARRTHPDLMSDGAVVRSTDYEEPAAYLRRTQPEVQPTWLESTDPAVGVDHLDDLSGLRQAVYLAGLSTYLSVETVDDFMVAVSEVASNALQHGAPPVRVRLWTRPQQLLCAVYDAGAGFDDPLVGLRAPRFDRADYGLGLWAVRQLCDRITFTQEGGGFTVRLSVGS